VTVRYTPSVREVAAVEESDPAVGRDLPPMFLIGKLLNALLLDPVQYDLHVLDRLNEVVQVLEQTLSPGDFDRVQRVWVEHRGMPYRHLRSLVFTPSRDLGELAADYLRDGLKMDKLSPIVRYVLERAVNNSPRAEADWASYLLFDGGFAAELIAIGHADALARRDEIRDFFQRG
jgi:NTE family protein